MPFFLLHRHAAGTSKCPLLVIPVKVTHTRGFQEAAFEAIYYYFVHERFACMALDCLGFERRFKQSPMHFHSPCSPTHYIACPESHWETITTERMGMHC